MQFQKFNSHYVVRLDKEEAIVGTLKNFCSQNNITLGSILGIGAAERLRVAFYSTREKKFYEKDSGSNLPGCKLKPSGQ